MSSSFYQKIPWSELAHVAGMGFVFFCILCGILIVPLGLPGTWLIAAGAVFYSLFFPFYGGATSALTVDLTLIGIAIFGEIVEFFVGTLGSKPLKVSNGAIACAFVGGIVGAVIGVPVFLIGSLLGVFLGAFLGAFLWELVVLKSFWIALTHALAVLATRVVATFLKTALAIGMSFYLILKLF